MTEQLRVSLEDIPLPKEASDGRPSAPELAQQQLAAAIEEGRRDYSDAPRWAQRDLHELIDIMLPGDLIIVGAITGNGKTAFMMSQMDFMADCRIPSLYVPLEISPEKVRRKWAAWKLKLDPAKVLRNRWTELVVGAQRAHEAMLADQAENPFVHFPPDRRITIEALEQWIRWGKEQFGLRVVFLDHFHRMNFISGGPADFRVSVTEVARELKDLGRMYDVSVIAAAQLNRAAGVDEHLDRYMAPGIGRLKESSGLGEEADMTLMLSRKMRPLKAEEVRAIRFDPRLVRNYEEPNTMVVTCRKPRLEDGPRDRSVLLAVDQGRVVDRAPTWRQYDAIEEREPT